MPSKRQSRDRYITSAVDLRRWDCLRLLAKLPDRSIDFLLTDPPYFLDQLDDAWSRESIAKNTRKAGTVGGLPVGMKFDPEQGRRLERFFYKVSEHAFRVLKPGAFMVGFSQGRLVHRLATAAEDAGFEIRDLFVWEHEGWQWKAFTQSHFVDRMAVKSTEKRRILKLLDGRKTPQLRPKFEPMILAQKPRDGTFVNNWLTWQTWLVKLDFEEESRQQTTIFNFAKPHKNKAFNHMTIKPEAMFERLIEVFTTEGQTVLDPFLWSGTTAIAAIRTGRKVVGFEIEPSYFATTIKRLQSLWIN